MKTFYKTFIIGLILLIHGAPFIHAQICVPVTAALEPDGTLILDPVRLLNVELQPGQSVFALPAYFTCDDLAEPVPVTLYRIDNGDTTYLCKRDVTVADSTPPVARCKKLMHVQLDENGEHRFVFDEANNNSYDLCSEITAKRFFPDRIRCTDPNPMDVMLVVRDVAGNQDTCTVKVSYSDYTGSTDPVSCRDSLVYYFFPGDEYSQNVSMEDIVKRGAYGCPNDYGIAIYETAFLRPDDSLTIDDVGIPLSAVLTDFESGAQCTTVISVKVVEDPCETVNNLMCDTKCHSEPFGDCASGHTDEDIIELPCDVSITDWCARSRLYPDPEFISWYGYPESENAWPSSGGEFVTNEDNVGSIFIGYWDQVIDLATGQQVIRTWTILNWCTQQTIEHVQHINITYNLTDVCDTLPWNAPAGDCLSGHTITDDVEWPADITIHSLFSHPDDLALNPEVQFENVRPRLNEECVVNDASYHDLVSVINDTTLSIERTWVVIDFYSQQQWQYVQIITVIHEGMGSIVCVATEDGRPIPEVELIPGVITDDSGCHEFTNPTGIIVTPVKDSPFESGVNILDLIILLEDFLGVRSLTDYQEIAADLNNSAALSTVDVIAFNNFLQGNFTPSWSHAWRFFEQTTHEGSADISDPLVPYKFIGVKVGDLDYSFFYEFNLEEIILRAEEDTLIAGETYSIPFHLERNESLAGFAVRLENENSNLDFLNVTAPNIPGFGSDNVRYEGDAVVIQWVSPAQHLINGVAVDSIQQLFIVEIRANENMILSEQLSLEATFDHLLKPASADPLEIRLSWEEEIISGIAELDNGRKIEFYPNPATDILQLKGIQDNEEGKIIFLDPVGRIAFESKLQSSVDISHLHTGMYYISLVVNGEKTPAVPLVKF